MLTMAPPPCVSIWRISNFMHRKIDFRLTAMMRSNVASSTSANGSRSSSIAAPFTAQCKPPYASTVPRTRPSTDPASATSVAKKRASPPAPRMISTVSLPPSAAMSDTATQAPSAANAMAIARPMPPAPPVTAATLPARIPSLIAPLVS